MNERLISAGFSLAKQGHKHVLGQQAKKAPAQIKRGQFPVFRVRTPPAFTKLMPEKPAYKKPPHNYKANKRYKTEPRRQTTGIPQLAESFFLRAPKV
ncbi:MAG: hypothetical protein WBY75_05415 [Terracidiphilus sp.]